MLPRAGAFYPYDDALQDGDDAGELVEIKGTVTRDFSVTPYLTIDWVKKPVVVDGTDGKYVECSVKFRRNQKAGYGMPDTREAYLLVSRSVNTSARLLDLYPVSLKLTNDMEGQELQFRTAIPLKYTGIDYWIRVSMNCQTAAGDASTNYPGMGADNFTTIEKIHVP